MIASRREEGARSLLQTVRGREHSVTTNITAFNQGCQRRGRAVESTRGEQQDLTAGWAAGSTAGERRRCCGGKTLFELNAFNRIVSKVEKIFKEAGHLFIFMRKYHPAELMPSDRAVLGLPRAPTPPPP